MSNKTKITAYTAAQFGQFTRDNKASLIAWSSALLFAISQCANEKSNTQPMNELMRLPTVQFKSHKLLQFGTIVKAYTIKMLGDSVQWQAEKGRFQFVHKSATKYIDIDTCERFADFFAGYGKKLSESDPNAETPKPVSASTLDKAIRKASENGLTAKDVKTAQSLLESVALLQTAALALVQSMQEKKDENAATVTDGATGDYSRNEAHGGPDAALAKAPKARKAEPIPQTAIGAAFAAAADKAHSEDRRAA